MPNPCPYLLITNRLHLCLFITHVLSPEKPVSIRRVGCFIGLCVALASASYGQSPTIDQLRAQLRLAQADSVRAKLYLALGETYMHKQQDSAISYLQKSVLLAQHQGTTHGQVLARGYLKLGYAYLKYGNFAKALTALEQAERIQRGRPPDSTLLETKVLTAVAYRSQGDYEKGLKRCLALLNQYDRPPFTIYRQLGMVYTELGVIYDHLHQYELAVMYHRKRLNLSKKGTNPRDLLIAYQNLGAVYSNTNKLAEAQTCFLQGLVIARQLNLASDIANMLTNLGDLANQRRQFTQSIAFHRQVLRMQDQLGEQFIVGWNHLMLASDYNESAQFQKALLHANKAITVFQTIRSARYLQQALEFKGKLLTQSGQYREALRVVQQAQVLNDSLTGLDKQKAIAQVQAAYDLSRKQDQIATLNKDLTIQKQAQRTIQLQLTVSQQQRLLYLISAILLAMLLVIGFLSYVKQKKAQRLLLRQKEEISVQAKQLTEINAAKDKLFSLISHDLRSPVARLKQNFYQLRQEAIMAPAIVQPLGQLESQVDQVMTLLTNLLDWSHSQLKGFRSHPQRIDLAEAVNDVASQAADHVRQKDLHLLNQVTPQTFITIDKHQLDSILRNVLSNAIKFTPEGGYIRLYTIMSVDRITLVIRDTGIGMSPDQLASLLTDPQVRSGTQGEFSTGLGLRLCQDLLAHQAGSLQVISQPQKGTTVRLNFVAA